MRVTIIAAALAFASLGVAPATAAGPHDKNSRFATDFGAGGWSFNARVRPPASGAAAAAVNVRNEIDYRTVAPGGFTDRERCGCGSVPIRTASPSPSRVRATRAEPRVASRVRSRPLPLRRPGGARSAAWVCSRLPSPIRHVNAPLTRGSIPLRMILLAAAPRVRGVGRFCLARTLRNAPCRRPLRPAVAGVPAASQHGLPARHPRSISQRKTAWPRGQTVSVDAPPRRRQRRRPLRALFRGCVAAADAAADRSGRAAAAAAGGGGVGRSAVAGGRRRGLAQGGGAADRGRRRRAAAAAAPGVAIDAAAGVGRSRRQPAADRESRRAAAASCRFSTRFPSSSRCRRCRHGRATAAADSPAGDDGARARRARAEHNRRQRGHCDKCLFHFQLRFRLK